VRQRALLAALLWRPKGVVSLDRLIDEAVRGGGAAERSFARLEAERLEELRVAAIEDRADAGPALGQHRAE
jgi:hypothetical protein